MTSTKQAIKATNEELAVQYQEGNKAALNALWEQNAGLLMKQAYSYYIRNQEQCAARGVTAEDLFQETYFSIEPAVKAFKSESGYRFTTYLGHHLKNCFRRITGVVTTKQCNEPLSGAYSLDKPMGEDEGTTIADALPDPAAQYAFDCVEDELFLPTMKNAVQSAMRQLEAQERRVIDCRFFRSMTLNAIAELEGVSRERIRQTEARALRSLRHPRCQRRLRPFLEYLNSWAYQGTGFEAWKRKGSVQERIVEKLNREDD